MVLVTIHYWVIQIVRFVLQARFVHILLSGRYHALTVPIAHLVQQTALYALLVMNALLPVQTPRCAGLATLPQVAPRHAKPALQDSAAHQARGCPPRPAVSVRLARIAILRTQSSTAIPASMAM